MLIGPNGSGKTTLLRLLMGSLKPDCGSVLLDGTPISNVAQHRLAKEVALVPQENTAFFPFSVAELVKLGVSANSRASDLDAILARFDLQADKDRSILQLSGGQRQRAHIARAWAQNSRFLLMDEPTAHLDIRHQEMLRKIMQESARRERKGFVVALHDLPFAMALADRLVLLHEGHILAEGSPESVLTPENMETAYGIPFAVNASYFRKPD